MDFRGYFLEITASEVSEGKLITIKNWVLIRNCDRTIFEISNIFREISNIMMSNFFKEFSLNTNVLFWYKINKKIFFSTLKD